MRPPHPPPPNLSPPRIWCTNRVHQILIPAPSSADRLPEGEAQCSCARVGEFDLEETILDRCRLADQLIEAWLADEAAAIFIDVESVCAEWRSSIEENPEPNGRAP